MIGPSDAAISAALNPVLTEYPIICVRFATPLDTFEVMVVLHPDMTTRHLVLDGLHVHAWSGGRNSIGWLGLRRLVNVAM